MTQCKKRFLFPIIILLIQSGYSQYTVSGTVTYSEGRPLTVANVLLLQAFKSTFVSGATSDDNGVFEIDTKNTGEYIVEVSVLGFDAYTSEIISLSDPQTSKSLGTVQLSEGAFALTEVEVVGSQSAFNVSDIFNSLERIGITDIPEENIYIERLFDFSQRTFN